MAGRAPVVPKKSKVEPPKTEPLKNTDSLPIEERIRQRAHEIYLARGGEDGQEMSDWLQAEREIGLSKEGHKPR
jgi:hypothetical protein